MDDSIVRDSATTRPVLNERSVAGAPPLAFPVYEELLDRDPRWALSEGSRHFEEDSRVFQALRKIAQRLETIGVPYAVVGGMALFRHGVRRFTEDVDILVTKKDLKAIHQELDGRGYLPPFPRSKNLRDTQLGVKIEFVIAGDYPGDGKEKPVAFPVPSDVSFEADGISFVNLATLVELKLASGMTNEGRLKDLADVIELIKTLDLPFDFADQLNPFVRSKFHDLWKQARRRYVMTWPTGNSSTAIRTIDDLIAALPDSAKALEQMKSDGIVVAEDGVRNDVVTLVTTDAKVAEKYGFVDELELWGPDDE